VTIYSDLPYVHALGDGGVRPATTCVVIHATDNTASASAEASYARTRPDKTSAHFYVDDRQVIQALDTSHIAYGCLYHGNRISIQFELCGLSNHVSDAVMRKAAATVARVCRDNGIPVRKVGASDVRNGVKGICGHGDITAAFPEDHGDHTDPGSQFPWSTFIGYVQGDDAVGINELAYNADSNAWAVRMGVDSQVYPGDNPGPLAHAGNPLWDLLRRLDTNVAADLAEDRATTVALKALVDQVNAAGGSVDAAPILAAIAAARDEESAAVAALHDQVADLTHRLAAAEQAAAAALTQA
jgi:hypothetical protein